MTLMVWPHVERNLFLVRGLGDLSIPKALLGYGANRIPKCDLKCKMLNTMISYSEIQFTIIGESCKKLEVRKNMCQ